MVHLFPSFIKKVSLEITSVPAKTFAHEKFREAYQKETVQHRLADHTLQNEYLARKNTASILYTTCLSDSSLFALVPLGANSLIATSLHL